ncbi:tyrosine-type recombinase/integrase [Ideonella sp.]|uniref:tyrosine-type recombinase/integrase n=1 Tax=Ideonella sp. TaxID=1929293 RepID=UPI002D7F4FBD|nr:tyrosine-type recombinase/integrase [Ideonella sp.]
MAEGLSISASAQRYLGIEHGNQAVTAHRQVVDHLRSVARRRGDKAWRLVGLTIRLRDHAGRPSLEDFVAERDLDDWSEAEVLLLYAEAYPEDSRADRRQRLRERQLQLLRELELAAGETPLPADPLDAWLEPQMAKRLRGVGLMTLGDLATRIAQGGRWWRGLPSIGELKAQRLAQHLSSLLPPSTALGVANRRFGLGLNVQPAAAADGVGTGMHSAAGFAAPQAPFAPFAGRSTEEKRADRTPQGPLFRPPQPSGGLIPVFLPMAGSGGLAEPLGFSSVLGAPESSAPSVPGALITARNDLEAIQAWVAARAGATATATSYRREALRLLLWLNDVRRKGFREAGVEDCLAYMAFLENLPPDWISRRHSGVMGEGWAPFRGPLSVASRRQAVVVLGSFFRWLVDVGYLAARNPWMLVNRRTGDDASRHELDSRAFTPEAWASILQCIQAQAPSPSRDRMLFVLNFVEATGLRAAELLSAKLGAFRSHKGRLALQVQGKGARNRVIAVPGQAEQALQTYLAQRGLPSVLLASPELPVLASTGDPLAPIGYQALYQTVKRWLALALRQSSLPPSELAVATKASPHWLRHTFGTRALEREAPLEVVQRQLGHADPRTTMRYAKAQLERLQAEMDEAFGGT